MGSLNMHSGLALVFPFLYFFLVQSLALPLALAKNGDQQF